MCTCVCNGGGGAGGCEEKQIDFKKLVHEIMEADKSKTYRVGQQASDLRISHY